MSGGVLQNRENPPWLRPWKVVAQELKVTHIIIVAMYLAVSASRQFYIYICPLPVVALGYAYMHFIAFITLSNHIATGYK